MLNYKVKIGLVPIRRECSPRAGAFNWEKAEERGRKAVEYIEKKFTDDKISFVDLKGINPVSVLFSENDADAVIARMRAEKADAVFFINGNFGNEEVAGTVASALGLPVLLWGPQDDVFEPDGMRYTDSQCGIFGVSRQFQRLNIPFTYIENCRIENDIFTDGLRSFISVVCMVKNFRGMRIGQIGMRPKPFCSVIFNEGELMQKFGIQVIPVNMAVVADRFQRILREKDEELEKGAEFLSGRYEIDEPTRPLLKKIYAFVLFYKEIFAEYRLNIISSECWTSMGLALGVLPCIAFSVLADEGYLISCESDLHGALSMALLSCAALGRKTPFFGEFTVRHPTDRNVELLWHCGQFPYSVKKTDCKARTVAMREWFQAENGTYTLARFDQDDGRYLLLGGSCVSADGPFTNGTYLWARFKNLSAWEKKLIYGPYIHHMAEIKGDYTEELREFCKYIPHLNPDSVE